MTALAEPELPRLVLGTAQLGLDYGIANTAGRPSETQAMTLLDRAWSLGLTAFDSARLYGDAERRIGAWIARTANRPLLVTKFPPAESGREVRRHVAESLTALGVAQLDGLLAHRAADLRNRSVLETVRALQRDGKIRSFGASVYEPDEAARALAVPGLGMLQAPLNAFDRRFLDRGVFARAGEAGVRVLARSPLLQGVLAMDPAALPAHLSAARTPLRRFRDLAREAGLKPVELALAMVLAQADVAAVVIGADSPDQLGATAAAAERAVDAEVIASAWRIGAGLPAAVINPSLWPKPR